MTRFYAVLGIMGFLLITAELSSAQAKCPLNMVRVGNLCVDTYEASVWSRRPDSDGNPRGTQFGISSDNYPCSDDGNDCHKSLPGKIFAASIPGVRPSIEATWFQAQQACFNVGKRLLRNDEWQAAAAGTRETNQLGILLCNTHTTFISETGSHPNCASSWGVFDMVGNVWEWVGDIVPRTSGCGTPLFNSEDFNCLGGDVLGVGALLRGGSCIDGDGAGVFAVDTREPSFDIGARGFRCAK